MAPRPLAKSPVSFSLGDEVPHIFIRESHQWPRKILISGGKRLFQQHRPKAVPEPGKTMQRSNLSSTRGTALVEHQRANARRPISPWFCFTKYAPTLSSNFNRCIFEEQHLLCLPAQDQVIVAAP